MKVLLITDSHIGYKNDNIVKNIDKIYDDNNVSKIILLGDIFDFWRNNISDIIIKFDDIFSTLNRNDLIYIKGNHDYVIDEILDLDIRKNYTINNNKKNIVFTHGYDFEMKSEYTFLTTKIYENFAEILCYSDNISGKIMNFLYKPIDKITGQNNKNFYNIMEYIYIKSKLNNEINIFGHYHKEYLCDDIYCLSPSFENIYYIYDINKNKIEKVFYNK